jgi:hypothetical protein
MDQKRNNRFTAQPEPIDVDLFCRVIRHQLLAMDPPPRLSTPDPPLDEPINNPYIPLARSSKISRYHRTFL